MRVRPRVNPCDSHAARGIDPCQAQTVTAARVAGPPSGSLLHVPACWRPGLQSQVREDPLDHRCFEDGGGDLELAAAVRAVLEVDLESEASAKTNLYSSYVAAKYPVS